MLSSAIHSQFLSNKIHKFHDFYKIYKYKFWYSVISLEYKFYTEFTNIVLIRDESIRSLFKIYLFHYMFPCYDSFYRSPAPKWRALFHWSFHSIPFLLLIVPIPPSLPRKRVARSFPGRLVWRSKREWSTYRRLIRFPHGCSGYYPLQHPSYKSRNCARAEMPKIYPANPSGKSDTD